MLCRQWERTEASGWPELSAFASAKKRPAASDLRSMGVMASEIMEEQTDDPNHCQYDDGGGFHILITFALLIYCLGALRTK